jgi:hypothetical protein
MQQTLMVAIALLVGLASAGLVWFGAGFMHKLQDSVAAMLAARKAKAAAKAEAAAEAAPDGKGAK